MESATRLFKMLILVIVSLFGVFLYGYYRLRATIYRQSNQAFMRQQRTVAIDKTQLVVQFLTEDQKETTESNCIYKQEDIFQVVTLKWCCIFFTTPAVFVFVPKRAFQNPGDLECFEKTILSVYPPRKKMTYRLFALICLLALALGIVISLPFFLISLIF